MLDFFHQGGIFMWPLLVLVIVIVVLSIKKAIAVFLKADDDIERHEIGINAIIFWGGISAVIGFFAHHSGVIIAMNAIKNANDISPAIVAHGYHSSLTIVITGLSILLISAISWFILRWRYKNLLMRP